MTDAQLKPGEKSALTDLARKAVDRGARALSTPAAPAAAPPVSDAFSEEGRLQRLLELEKRLDGVSRDWSTTLGTVMFAVERIESRLARLEGEVEGLHESDDRLDARVRQHAQDLTASAERFGEAAATRLEAVLDRVEALVARRRS